jgi:hypothetical protein
MRVLSGGALGSVTSTVPRTFEAVMLKAPGRLSEVTKSKLADIDLEEISGGQQNS